MSQNKEDPVHLYYRIEKLRELLEDKEKKNWHERRFQGKARVELEIETRHIICQVMGVKRKTIKGFGGTFVYSNEANLARCTKCSTYFTIPDRQCPCCGYALRRNHHQKSERQNRWQDKERQKHEIL